VCVRVFVRVYKSGGEREKERERERGKRAERGEVKEGAERERREGDERERTRHGPDTVLTQLSNVLLMSC
jgi:hypothetical protein